MFTARCPKLVFWESLSVVVQFSMVCVSFILNAAKRRWQQAPHFNCLDKITWNIARFQSTAHWLNSFLRHFPADRTKVKNNCVLCLGENGVHRKTFWMPKELHAWPVSQDQTTTVLFFRRRCVVLKFQDHTTTGRCPVLCGCSGPANDQLVWSLSGPVTPVSGANHQKTNLRLCRSNTYWIPKILCVLKLHAEPCFCYNIHQKCRHSTYCMRGF